MNFKDLFIIGRLGKIIVDENEYHFIANDNFQLAFLEESAKVFLIFTEHRVFFVEINEFCMKNSKYYISFKDEGILEEFKKNNSCKVAVPKDEFYSQQFEEDYSDILDFTAVKSDSLETIGTVIDFIYNPKQRIIVIEDSSGKEILIPEVDYYIDDIDSKKRVITIKNSQGLLDL